MTVSYLWQLLKNSWVNGVFLALVRQAVWEKENIESKPTLQCFKNDLVSLPPHDGEVLQPMWPGGVEHSGGYWQVHW